jgi:hypothetical protein
VTDAEWRAEAKRRNDAWWAASKAADEAEAKANKAEERCFAAVLVALLLAAGVLYVAARAGDAPKPAPPAACTCSCP